MKETNVNAMDFNTTLKLRKAFIQKENDLISATESNELWDHCEDKYYSSSSNYFETVSSYDEIIEELDSCLERAHQYARDNAFDCYHDTLISKLSENYYDNWNLIHEILDGILPAKDWPNFDRYIEDANKAEDELEASPEAIELRQLKEKWKELKKCPRGDFSVIDWSVFENRSQFCDWLNAHEFKDEAEWLLCELNYSDCFDYEDFCLSAPSWMIFDDSWFLKKEGLLSNFAFLINHSDKFDSWSILNSAISDINDVIRKYPKEMLVLLTNEGENFAEEILNAVEENYPDIPDAFLSDYQSLFEEFQAYC